MKKNVWTSVAALTVACCTTAVSAQTPRTVTVGFAGSDIEHAHTERHLAAYAEKHPEIDPQIVTYRGGLTGNLQPEEPGEPLPDLVLVNTRVIEEIKDDLREVSKLLEQAGIPAAPAFHEKAWRAVQVDNRPMALPYFCLVDAMYYNRTLFDESNVTYPSAGWDWEDFVRKARKLTDSAADSPQWGYMCLYDQYSETADWIVLAGGRWGPDMYYYADTLPQSMEAMKFVSDLSFKFGVTPKPKIWAENYLRACDERPFRHTPFFTSGQFAMFKGSSWHLNELKAANMENSWDMAPLPAHRRKASVVSVFALGIPATCSDPEEAARLADYLIRQPERGLPAIQNRECRDRFLAFHEIQDKNWPALYDSLEHGILAERGTRDARLNKASVRAKPWHLMKQPWTEDVAAKYQETIKAFHAP